jgi:choice-of-anchor A domain-containing protein
VNYYGTLQFVGTNANLNTFVVQAADFNSANGIQIDAPTGSTVVINVAGLNVNFQNLGINFTNLNGDATGATDKTHVVYNFYQAQTLGISGISVQGSVLAPLANVTFSNGNIEGNLVAGNLTGSGETHDYPFVGTLPIPEPSSLALVAATFGGFLMRRRR